MVVVVKSKWMVVSRSISTSVGLAVLLRTNYKLPMLGHLKNRKEV